MEIEPTLSEILTVARGRPDVSALRDTRQLLFKSEFGFLLDRERSRAHNRSDILAELRDKLGSCRMAFQDQIADRAEEHEQLAIILVGGGSTLAAGALIGLGAQVLAFPPMALLPLACGCYAAWRGARERKSLALELSILNDIVKLLDGHLDRLESRE